MTKRGTTELVKTELLDQLENWTIKTSLKLSPGMVFHSLPIHFLYFLPQMF